MQLVARSRLLLVQQKLQGLEVQEQLCSMVQARARHVMLFEPDCRVCRKDRQAQKALDALSKGRVDSFSMMSLGDGRLQMVADRAGKDGFQRLIYTLDPSGKTVGLIQEAYNSAGELVHVHDKLKDVVIK